uniref:Uncharacterized protein n=1 Tax=Anguilla anguilla TaxID=7936 RepID=A0A0E9UMW8_ANGAN
MEYSFENRTVFIPLTFFNVLFS